MGLSFNYEMGQTPIDENEKVGLKIHTITTQQELDEFEQLNIEKAIEWTLTANLKPSKILSESFIKQLHRKMFSEVWNWAGKFRQSEKNIGTKWVNIPTEVKTLLDDVTFWIEHQTFSPEEIAIRFKHRLVSIHCFPNGNGRHSRIMADLILQIIYNQPIFTWAQNELIQPSEKRRKYIQALKKADNGFLDDLIAFACS